MSLKVEFFLKKFSEEINNGTAAIFAGAGLSREQGFVNWMELLHPLAQELEIPLDNRELTKLAQFYKNHSGNRYGINKELIKCFNRKTSQNTNIELLLRMPIDTYWTTNYDHVIEETAKANHISYTVYKNSSDFYHHHSHANISVYKLHGDVDYPEQTILTSDDYAQFETIRPMYREFLKCDLLSKSFLFIGFSFSDPNLDLILNHLRDIVKDQGMSHYWITQKVDSSAIGLESDRKYQNLIIEDLKRFGIRTVLVDSYNEIPEILKKLLKLVNKYNIFISGSADFYSDDWPEELTGRFCYTLGYRLIQAGFRITCGFGNSIGSSILNGALDALKDKDIYDYSDYIKLYPFPQNVKDTSKRQEIYTSYRKQMIKKTGTSIFLFGNKYNDNNRDSEKGKDHSIANGCIEEFEISKQNENLLIPVPTTGFASEKIMEEIKKMAKKFFTQEQQEILTNSKNIDEIVNTIIEIIEKEE